MEEAVPWQIIYHFDYRKDDIYCKGTWLGNKKIEMYVYFLM